MPAVFFFHRVWMMRLTVPGGLNVRFAPYQPRLASAMARVVDGERDYFTKPIIDSFHTVWFELHEDLLTSLGLERSQEGG